MEARALQTSSFQHGKHALSYIRWPTFPASSNVTVPASETSSPTCNASFKDMCKANLNAPDTRIVDSGWLHFKVSRYFNLQNPLPSFARVGQVLLQAQIFFLCNPRSCSSAPDEYNRLANLFKKVPKSAKQQGCKYPLETFYKHLVVVMSRSFYSCCAMSGGLSGHQSHCP